MTEELGALGWDGEWAATFEEVSPQGGRPARVTAQHRDRWTIQSDDGAWTARLVKAEAEGARPVTGDWVAFSPGPHPSDPSTIHCVLPRRSAVRRGAAGDSRSEQVLAANVDRLWIVQALDTPLNLRSLERYLVVGWESGAVPEIVLTKADLAEDPGGAIDAVAGVALGVTARVVSVEDADALAALRNTLTRGQTVALVGPSGAGKSTLINHLAGFEVARTGEVRVGDKKGRHTTTDRELFPIHNGALLLDTPGMRELKVGESHQGLSSAFPDIEELAGACRFRDCSHTSEPGCAVLLAVREGHLDADRLASYRKLEVEAAFERRRTDPRARAEHLADHKTAMRTMKYHHKRQSPE